MEKEFAIALAKILLIFTEGRNYKTQNPYSRPEVKEGLKLLKKFQGGKELDKFSYMDVDLKKIVEDGTS